MQLRLSGFGDVFQKAREEAGMTQLEFAKKAGCAQASISQITAGKRTPPLDLVDQWADILGLKGEKRAEFLEIACLEHCPEPIRHEYMRLKMSVQKLESRLDRLEKNEKERGVSDSLK